MASVISLNSSVTTDEIDSPWVGPLRYRKYAEVRPSHEWIRILGSRCVKFDVKDWGVKNGFQTWRR